MSHWLVLSDIPSWTVGILAESAYPSATEESKIISVLEDATSPVRNKYLEKLFDSVIDKNHIDFDNIPMSKGNIVDYVGYTNMIEVLENVIKLASDNKAQSVVNYAETVKEAIRNMRNLSPEYSKGFAMRNEYVMLEYNTFVYTIVQATSTLLYEFVDYVKKPTSQTMDIVIKNTKYRANSFYFDQLSKFNAINHKMDYAAYLRKIISSGVENFTGVEAIGLGVVVAVALAIVPVTRELVYQYYNMKSNISDCLAQQAYFLEMNKTVIEANSDFNEKKKTEILMKQERVKNLCVRLSDKLRVTHIKSVNSGKAAIQNDNKLLTIDTIKKEVSDSPLQLY